MGEGLCRRFGVLALVAAGVVVLAPQASAKKQGPGKVKTRTAVASATGHQAIATATAKCPKGSRATGGGFAETAPGPASFPVVYESLKSGQRSWRVSAQQSNLAAGPKTVDLSAYVYCRRGAPKTQVATATVVTADSLQTGPTATATCPSGRNVQSGGFSTPPPIATSGAVFSNMVLTSRAAGTTAWEVGVGSQATSSVVSYAYCAKPKSPGAASTTSAPIAATATPLSTDATCPGKKKALSGGFHGTSAFPPSPLSYLHVNESRRNGKGWRASATHYSVMSATSTLTSTAYCGR